MAAPASCGDITDVDCSPAELEELIKEVRPLSLISTDEIPLSPPLTLDTLYSDYHSAFVLFSFLLPLCSDFFNTLPLALCNCD